LESENLRSKINKNIYYLEMVHKGLQNEEEILDILSVTENFKKIKY
jgi:hypothetical protein